MHEWGLPGGGEATHLQGEGEKESKKEGEACAKTLRRIEQPVGRPVGLERDTEREEDVGLGGSWKDEYI